MTTMRQKVLETLEEMKIPYEIIEHPAVYTMEDMEQLNFDNIAGVVKNLFIRDDKKNRYFLMVLQKDKKANLKEMRTKLDSRPLTFASEKCLSSIMGLNTGAVSPFGILNDDGNMVEVVIDKDIFTFEKIGIHPNDNTATLWISPQDLELFVKSRGNTISYID